MTLSVENVGLLRGNVLALDRVSCALKPGQITAICGPNGAGKSSLLMVLAGLLSPSAGSAALNDSGLNVIPLQERAKRLGYLPQIGDIAWDLSVRNLVALGRLPHRDRGTAQIEGALEATHLTDLAERPVSTLSGGERARALLARVFAGDPEWVLADEPLAALDFYYQLEVLASLRVAADLGRGVVLVLHDLALAMNHADHVIVLQDGRLVAEGTPEEALSMQNIADVWGVAARWLGEPGARALVTGGGS